MGVGALPTLFPVEAGEGLTHCRVGVGYQPWLWMCTSWGQPAGRPPPSARAACPASRKGLTTLRFLLCPVTAEADLPGQLGNFPPSAACLPAGRLKDQRARGRAAAPPGDPASTLPRGLRLLGEGGHLQDRGPWWMALGTLPRLCCPPAAQVGRSLQRLLVVPGLGPREPAPEVSWCLRGGGGASHGRLGA